MDRLGDHRPDVFGTSEERLFRLLHDLVEAAEVLGQHLRVAAADVADIEPDQESPQRLLPRLFDPLEQVVDRLFSHPLQFQELVAAIHEAVQVGNAPDEPGRRQLLHQLVAQPLDVHGAARRVVVQRLAKAARAIGIGTADVDAVFVAHDWRFALGAVLGKVEGPLRAVATMQFDADDVRDHLARLLDDDPIPLHDPQAARSRRRCAGWRA